MNEDLFVAVRMKRARCGHETEVEINGMCEKCARRAGYKPLRGYQILSVKQVFSKYLSGGKSVVLCLPTGAGKTRTCAEIVYRIYQKRLSEGKTANFLCLSHRDMLRVQMMEALESLMSGLIGVIKGKHREYIEPIQMATIQTLARRFKDGKQMPEADLVIVDECHRAKATQYNEVLNYYKEKGARILGLTATPVRLDKRPLNDVFDDIVLGTKTAKLIEQGYLVKPRIYAKYSPDLKNIRSIAGDYSEEELDKQMNCLSSNQHVLDEYKRLADGKKAIFFAVTVRHAVALCDLFNLEGISSAVISASVSEVERNKIIQDFKEGTTLCLFNCEILTEGIDLPDIEVCGLIRPTKSLSLYLQMVGRSLRLSEGKTEAVVLDHSGNCEYHGLPDDDFPWDVYFTEGYNKPDNHNNFKNCPQCYALLPVRTRVCQICQYSFTRILSGGTTEKEILDLPLEEIFSFCASKESAEAQRILRVIEKARKYKTGWNKHVFSDWEKDNAKTFYFDELFRSIFQWEGDHKIELSPVNKEHIKIAQSLDLRKHNGTSGERR